MLPVATKWRRIIAGLKSQQPSIGPRDEKE
jgi:hypothetical protein